MTAPCCACQCVCVCEREKVKSFWRGGVTVACCMDKGVACTCMILHTYASCIQMRHVTCDSRVLRLPVCMRLCASVYACVWVCVGVGVCGCVCG